MSIKNVGVDDTIFGCLMMGMFLLFLGCMGASCIQHQGQREKALIPLDKFCDDNDCKVKILYYTEGQEGGKSKFQVVYCVVEGFKNKERRILRVSLNPNNNILPLPNEVWKIKINREGSDPNFEFESKDEAKKMD